MLIVDAKLKIDVCILFTLRTCTRAVLVLSGSLIHSHGVDICEETVDI